ncbi:MAG: M23 family metallopeptidase [Kofleriaceae bacterium]|nr:M23 family metallopeptidase [Kofleriaceae bacterium]MCL4225580.1 M23 family metallopeptidase [Myxococcales bacterium]
MIGASQAIERAPTLLVPMAIGAATVGGLLWWRHRNERAPRTPRTPATTGDDFRDDDLPMVAPAAPPAAAPSRPPGRWIFPVPRWHGRDPEVSDGWGSPRVGGNRGGVHRGVDIMFRRRHRGELADIFPPRAPGMPSPHTRGYFLPPGTLVLAAANGEVWSAGWTPTGYSVVISHGAPWATYYTHLASLRVGETRRGASRERVRAGQPLGVVGASPRDARGVAHLHFEMWHGGNGNAAIDPAPHLRTATIVDAPEVS